MIFTLDDINGFDDIYPSGESACCGAPIYGEDICSECGEHCSSEVTCPDCFGSGEVDVLDYKSVKWWTISPPYRKEKCESCGGEGWLEE